jgi:hypothetical protein
MRNNPIVATVISLLTFPGIIVHELAHSTFCNITRVQVYKVCYFRLGNPSGFVIHEPASSYWKAILIDIAPFLINTLISLLLFAIAVNLSQSFVAYLLYWLGISTAIHSFPSNSDADNLWSQSKSFWKRNPLALISFPIVGIIKLVTFLSKIGFDLLYAVALLLLVSLLFKGESLWNSLIR